MPHRKENASHQLESKESEAILKIADAIKQTTRTQRNQSQVREKKSAIHVQENISADLSHDSILAPYNHKLIPSQQASSWQLRNCKISQNIQRL